MATGARRPRTRSARPRRARPAGAATNPGSSGADCRARRTAGKDKADGEPDAEGGDDAAEKVEPEPEPDNVRCSLQSLG